VPVALKLSGADVQHKSEAGALALGLMTAGEIEAESRRLLALATGGGAQLLVERMADPGVELFVAATADGVVPALVVGLGGIWTEVLDDVAIIPLPADAERIERALRSLRGAPALTGGRGRDPVDLEAVAKLAAGAGRMLLEAGLALVELNPVVARPDGAVALDAVAAR
jgi:acetate---CoA ligase (ADP-forming)